MAAAVLIEEAQTNQVHNEPHGPHPQNHPGVVDGLWLVETLQTLHSNGEAKHHQKYCITKAPSTPAPMLTSLHFLP